MSRTAARSTARGTRSTTLKQGRAFLASTGAHRAPGRAHARSRCLTCPYSPCACCHFCGRQILGHVCCSAIEGLVQERASGCCCLWGGGQPLGMVSMQQLLCLAPHYTPHRLALLHPSGPSPWSDGSRFCTRPSWFVSPNVVDVFHRFHSRSRCARLGQEARGCLWPKQLTRPCAACMSIWRVAAPMGDSAGAMAANVPQSHAPVPCFCNFKHDCIRAPCLRHQLYMPHWHMAHKPGHSHTQKDNTNT